MSVRVEGEAAGEGKQMRSKLKMPHSKSFVFPSRYHSSGKHGTRGVGNVGTFGNQEERICWRVWRESDGAVGATVGT